MVIGSDDIIMNHPVIVRPVGDVNDDGKPVVKRFDKEVSVSFFKMKPTLTYIATVKETEYVWIF